MLSAARFSPPPEFQTNPAFQTDGLFDIQKYQAFLASPTVDDMLLLQLEMYYRDVIPQSKLMRQVSSDLYVTDAALWDEYRTATSGSRSVTLLSIPRSGLPTPS